VWSWSIQVEVRSALGDAFLAGPWDDGGLEQRALMVLETERTQRWLRPLVRRTLAAYREPPCDRRREFHAWLAIELERIARRARPPRVVHRLFAEAAMGRTRWDVPPIATTTELAAFLDVQPWELSWLDDVRGSERTVVDEQLRNYRYAWVPRVTGLPRLIESPKRQLKDLQRRVLHQILDRIPPHDASHGFRRGHSALTNARRHLGQGVVIGFDLEDFFASVTVQRLYGVFRSAGYPEPVAHRLAALCTNVVPRAVWTQLGQPHERHLLPAYHRLGQRLAAPHLPQGAPTSPALANLCAFGIDRRLSALAAAAGATYSRYADDIAFSGDGWLIAHQADFRGLVTKVVTEEGFRLNERKSHLTTRAGRQVVTGVVVNERPNVPRPEYDRLKATLRDAAVNGPAAANRREVADFRSHLAGRIEWVGSLNPARGAKLRSLFGAIEWDSSPP
jgi:retron-type reverse transcriptase